MSIHIINTYGNFTHILGPNGIVEEIPKNLGHEEMTIEVVPHHFALVISATILKIIEYVAFFKKFF